MSVGVEVSAPVVENPRRGPRPSDVIDWNVYADTDLLKQAMDRVIDRYVDQAWPATVFGDSRAALDGTSQLDAVESVWSDLEDDIHEEERDWLRSRARGFFE